MFALLSRSSDPMQRKLAENKARLLMLALGEIGKTWPAGTWILRLFESIFKKQQEKNQANSQALTQNGLPPASTMGTSTQLNNNFGSTTSASHSLVDVASYGWSDRRTVRLGEEAGIADFQWDPQLHQPSLNVSDPFEAEHLAEFSSRFDVGNQDFFPYLMEFNSFQDI